MALPITPLTKLDAVNELLASVGLAPVNTLDATGIRDVNIAALTLDKVTLELMNRGMSFNTDTCYELTPDVNNNILLPATALEIDPTDPTVDYVVRDNAGTRMLWDRVNHTWTITEPVEVDVIWAMEFEELPSSARTFVAIRAGRIFQAQQVGSELLFKFSQVHEREAWTVLRRREGKRKDRNVLRGSAETNYIYNRRTVPLR